MNRTDDDEPLKGRWIAMAALLVASFMNLMDVTIVNVAIPSLAAAFDASDSQIEWVVAVYILTFALLLLPMGRLGDRFGRRRMFVAGVCVFTIGSALCGMAPSVEGLIGARVLQGVGGAMMTPQTLAIVPALFAPKERGLAFALFGLSAGLASVSGPVLGGALIGADIWGLGWRPIFLVNVPVGVIAVVATLRFVPDLAGEKGLEIDFVGIMIAAAALFCVLFPLIEGRQLDWPVWIFAMMFAAVPLLGLFFWWQRRRAASGLAQLVPISLFQNRAYVIGTFLVMMLFAGMPGFFFVLAILLQQGNGLTALQSGLTTMPFSVGVLVASGIAGRLGNRVPQLRISMGGAMTLFCVISLPFLLPGAGETLNREALILPLLIGGLGLGTAISPMFNIVLSQVNDGDTGSASGALQSFQQVGGALGLAVMGQLFFGYLGRNGNAISDYSTAFQHALWFATFTFACVAIFVWRLPRLKQAKLDNTVAA